MSRFELHKNSLSRYLGRSVNLAIELSHSEFEDTYYLVNDTKELIIDGKTYTPYIFDLALPAQTEQQGTQFIISNANNIVAQQIEKIVNSNENIILKLYLVNIEDEVAEMYDKGEFEIMDIVVSPESATATINIRHCLNYNIGTLRYNKQLFRNLSL